MAQARIHDEGHDSSAKFFNQKFRDIIGKFVLQGFNVERGTAPLKVTIHAGRALLDGVEILETTDLENVLTLNPGSPIGKRYDVIALQYQFNETYPPNEASFVIVEGTPGSDPQKPALAEDQLELATITVYPNAGDISNSDIAIPLKFRGRLHDLIHRGLTTWRKVPLDMNVVVWDTEQDPVTLGYDVRNGDMWTPKNESQPILRVYDEGAQQWIEKDHWDNIRMKPRLFPPEVHSLGGESHSGLLPIWRVYYHVPKEKAHRRVTLIAGELNNWPQT